MSINRIVVWPYLLGSNSARGLSRGLNTIRVRSNGNYRHRLRDLVINWGNTTIPRWYARRAMLNLPQYVLNASDKVRTFQQLVDVPDVVVPWTTDRAVATQWLSQPLYPRKINAIVCRTLTRANSGRGIVIAKTPEEIVSAPLYTRYKPKSNEYRIHVFNGSVIDVQEKRRRNGFTGDSYVRNHPNGWVFCRENVTIPDPVVSAALLVMARLHLDFGAVDVGYHSEFGVGVYEINTAPGLEGQTLQNYLGKFRACV